MSTLEIAYIAGACLVLVGALVIAAMMRDQGDSETTIPPDVGSIEEPRI